MNTPHFDRPVSDGELTAVLRQTFGLDGLFPVQQQVLDRLLRQRAHALLLLPTGGGKSLCYQLPAMVLPGLTLVLSPLVALMEDQVSALQAKGVAAACLNATVPAAERQRRLAAAAAGQLRMLFVTPERFRNAEFRRVIGSVSVSLLAVDEAHCISEWGQDFRPDYSRIAEFRELIGNPLTVALTATATPEVQRDIIRVLGLKADEIRIFNGGVDRPNLALEVIHTVDYRQKLEQVLRLQQEAGGPLIIYFALVRTLEEFSALLQQSGVPHLCYHGKLPARERTRVQRRFMQQGGTVLATNAFGMGIDKADIRMIIHAELPGSLEAYSQEIGRAGRDGKPSRCVLLYDQADLTIQMEFIKWTNPEPYYYRNLWQELQRAAPELDQDGIAYLRDRLHWKTRHDFRLETALTMLARYGVLRSGSWQVLGDLPPVLTDGSAHEEKLRRDRMRLLELVNFVQRPVCRHQSLAEYFGHDAEACGRCDLCTG